MCPSRRVVPLVVRTSALRSIGCEKSRASRSVSVCAVPGSRNMPRGRRRGAGPGAAGSETAPGAARSSLHRGARFYLPAFERKFTSAPVADGTPLPPAALHTLTQSPLAR